MRLITTMIADVLGVTSSQAAAERCTAQDIRDGIVGRRIFLAVPFGGEFPLKYREDGRGEALGLGRFAKPNDTGNWWIQADRSARGSAVGMAAHPCASISTASKQAAERDPQ